MTFAEFYQWWTTQLGEMVPARVRQLFEGQRATLWLTATEGDRLSAAATPDSSNQIALPSDGTLLDSAARKSLPKGPQRVNLALPPGNYLLRRFTLPLAARANLAKAVGYQLPQQTPFSADQVIYACGEDKARSAADTLGVWLVAVPHRRIAGALRSLDMPLPTNPASLNGAPNADETLTLSWRVAELPSASQRWLPIAGIGLIVLFGAVLALHLHNRQSAQQELEDALAQERARAAQVGALREKIERTRTNAEWLQNHRQTAASPLELLNTLSKRLDDGTWLQRFELNEREISLSGISPSPAELIEVLEATPILENVRFDAAITQNRNEEGNRFNISAEIEPRTDGGGS